MEILIAGPEGNEAKRILGQIDKKGDLFLKLAFSGIGLWE